ncbi:MAG TPA: hypothetical protein VI756_20190 [Blastocatellia bacterium]
MKFQTLEKIDRTKFTSLVDDQETFLVGGQSSNIPTHLVTLTPTSRDVGMDMISDV